MNQNLKNMFKSTFCSNLQIIKKKVCQIRDNLNLIFDLGIFSVYGHEARNGTLPAQRRENAG